MNIDIMKLGRFGFVGGLGTVVYVSSLWLMVEKLHIPVMIATSLSFILVVIENYILHYHWTFGSSRSHKTAFPRFLLMSITGFTLNWVIMYVGTNELHYNYMLVQTLSIIVIVIWNLVISSCIFQASGKNRQQAGQR